MSNLEISAYHIARMTRRGTANFSVDGKYVVYSSTNTNSVDGGFMVIHDNGHYGIVTNEGLFGTSGYIVSLTL